MTGAGSPKKPAAPRKKKKRAGPVSLHPMSFDDAMRALLQVKPSQKGDEERSQTDDQDAIDYNPSKSLR